MKTYSLSTRVLAMLLTLVMVIGMIPMTAFAADAVPETAPTYEFGSAKTVLKPGKYDLPLVMNKADRPAQSSMAGSCIKGAVLTVAEDGSAKVTINLGAVSVSTITGWGSDWKIYTENGFTNAQSLVACEKTTNAQGEADSITFTMPDNSWDGVYTHMYIAVMGVEQDAYFKMDFAGATPFKEPVPVTFSAGANGALVATVNNKEIKSGDLVKYGAKVIFTAKANEGYVVDSWTGVEATGNSVAVTADKALDVRVSFTEKVIKNYAVTFSAGANGAVTAVVDGKAIQSGDKVKEGSTVIFTAVPADGYQVGAWDGATGDGNSANAIVNGDLNVNVSFKLVIDRTELDKAIADAEAKVAAPMDYPDDANWADMVDALNNAKNPDLIANTAQANFFAAQLNKASAKVVKLDKTAFSAAYNKFDVSWRGKSYAGYPKAVTKPCDEVVKLAQSYNSKRAKNQAEIDAVTEQMVAAYDALQTYIEKDIKLVSIKHADGTETAYINVVQAFKAYKADTDTVVTLLQDLELVDSVSGSKVPLDLNGFTMSIEGQLNVAALTSSKANAVLNANLKFDVEATLDANLTINGQIYSKAKITIDGAAINAPKGNDAFGFESYWHCIPEIVVNSGTITAKDGYAIPAYIDDGWEENAGKATKITINGGTLVGKDYAIKGISPVIVNGGQFKAAKGAVTGTDTVVPEGQKLSLVADENGFFKLIPAETPETVKGVISVNDTEYATVEEAFKNITAGAKLKLLADADVMRYTEIAQNCTLDLNGYKLTVHPYNQDANHQKYKGDYWCVVKILEGIKLDVIDSSTEKTGTLSQISAGRNVGFLVFGEMTVTDILVDNQNVYDGGLILTFNTTKSKVVADNIHLTDTNKGSIFNGGNEAGITVLKNITETFDSQKDTLLQSDDIVTPAYTIENCHFTDAGSSRKFSNNVTILNTTWEFTKGGMIKIGAHDLLYSAVIDNSTITTSNASEAVSIEYYKSAALKNSTIKNTDGFAVNFKNALMNPFAIESGTYEGKDYAIAADPVAYINGGQFKGTEGAVKGQPILPKDKAIALGADGYYKLIDGTYNPFEPVSGKDAAIYDSDGSLLGGFNFVAGVPVLFLPNEGKVVLQKDAVVTGVVNLSMLNGGRYTFDLNGHKLELKKENKDAFLFDKGTAVTFEDSVGTAVVEMAGTYTFQIGSAEGTEITITGGTWNTTNMFGQYSQARMVFAGGHFNVQSYYGLPPILCIESPNFVVTGGDYNYDVSLNMETEYGNCDPLNHETHDAYQKDGRWYVVPMSEMPAPEAPVITPDSKKFASGETIEVSMTAPEGDIYYTLDGSKPTSKSTKYEAPFTVDKTTKVTAVVVMAGGRVSAFAEANYTLVDPAEELKFGSAATKLEPGTYVVPISLRHAAKHQNPSAAVDAFPAVGTLTIDKYGNATLETTLNAVKKAGLVDMAYNIKVYQEDNCTSATKDVTVVETVTNPEGIFRPDASKDKVVPSKISFQIPNNKWDGVYMNLYVDAMNDAPDAWLQLNYAKAVAPGTEQHFKGEAKVNQFGKYNILADVTVVDGVITNVDIKGEGFGGTHADFNKTKVQKVTDGLKAVWNGIAPTQDNAEKIFKTIMKSENEPLDAVSGATMSAKTARDAVMKALNLTYVEEIINVPETVEPGIYEVEIGYYSDVVWHSLVENAKTKATLTVNEDKTMSLSFDTKSGTDKEPLYILGFNGIYPNNDKTQKLTMDGCKTVMGLSSNDYEDQFFAKGTQVVNHVEFPLQGGLSKIYTTNAYLYVPAMNKLNGLLSGVEFENGKFNVDIFAKIYWDSMNKIGDVPGTDPEKPVEKEGTITITMKKDGKQENSMCNVMFAEKGDVRLNQDGTVTIKVYVAYPVPAFSDQGMDGTVKDVVITFNGTTYTAVSDITTKPLMTVKESNPVFGLVKDDQIPAQILTFTLPKEALDAKFLDVGAYVNVVMNTNVDFDMYLSDLVWGEAKPDPEIPDVNHPAVDAQDEATGIKVHADKNIFLETVKLVVDPIVKGEDRYQEIADIMSSQGTNFNIFAIAMTGESGAQVQPNGKVTISFPVPDGWDAAKLALYRINDNGTKTKVNGTAENGFFTVIQKDFGTYALVEVGSKDVPADGWYEDAEKGWYFLENGEKRTNAWIQDSVDWVYLNAEGYVTVNAWASDTHGTCYLGASGYMTKDTWMQDGDFWLYLDAKGYLAVNAWAADTSGWCYLGNDGHMVKNAWAQDSVGWCYLGNDGHMVKNAWAQDSMGWCYLNGDGYLLQNAWAQDSVGWCYLGDDGRTLKNAWAQDSTGWCYLNSDGYVLTNGWAKDSYDWCYMDADGHMMFNAWVMDSVGWCYVGEDGYLLRDGYAFDSTGEHYLDASGHMAS